MTRTQARRANHHVSTRGYASEDYFCLTPIGIRVGYGSSKLPAAQRKRYAGHIIWISTSNPRYAVHGIRPGATLAMAQVKLKLSKVFPIGANDWYLAPVGSATAVLKVRHGLVEEIGIGRRSLTTGRSAGRAFLTSFS
jgi:hypothetical protein